MAGPQEVLSCGPFFSFGGMSMIQVTNLTFSYPVSYTHLDVYKRQSHNWAEDYLNRFDEIIKL